MNRNTKITIITLVVLIVLVGISLWILDWQNNKNSTTTTNKTTNSNLQTVTSVTFTGSKFSPSQITVDSGTTIEFINNSSDQLWVTSGTSGFDSGKTIIKGGSYAHTFSTKGTFTYQNKLDSAQTGQVTVL